MTLVFFIGGCTYAEISAFRYLSESTESMLSLLFIIFFHYTNVNILLKPSPLITLFNK